MDQRDDYQQAERTREKQHEEHGKGNTRIHRKDQVRQRRSDQFTGTFRACRPQNGLEVVRPSINNVFILKLASSFTVGIFIMERAIIFVSRTQGVFAHRQWRFPCKRQVVYTNRHAMSRSRTRDFSRVVFFVSRVSACERLSHASHVHVAQGSSCVS